MSRSWPSWPAEIIRLEKTNAALLEALELPLMFHAGSPWTPEKQLRWQHITGSTESTTKVMCDTIRAAIAAAKGAK